MHRAYIRIANYDEGGSKLDKKGATEEGFDLMKLINSAVKAENEGSSTPLRATSPGLPTPQPPGSIYIYIFVLL